LAGDAAATNNAGSLPMTGIASATICIEPRAGRVLQETSPDPLPIPLPDIEPAAAVMQVHVGGDKVTLRAASSEEAISCVEQHLRRTADRCALRGHADALTIQRATSY
jgi:hypothetical protein